MIGKWMVVWLLVATLVTPAMAKEPAPTPDRQQREINQELQACLKAAQRDAEKEGGLLAPGLKACFELASNRWIEATDRLVAQFPHPPQSACGRTLQALRQQWQEHAEKLLALEVLQELPINSDDEFRLVLGKHLYELVFELVDNSEC